MSRSSIAAAPISDLEARLRDLVRHHLGLDVDQLVGQLSGIADGAGEPDIPAIRVRAWVGRAPSRTPRLGRAFTLDAYTLEVLIDDARRLGRGARLDLVVARRTPAFAIDAIRSRLASLRRRGVDVRVRVERRRRGHGMLCGS